MSNRICIVDGCGRELGALQRSGAKCRECQVQERQALKDMKHQQRGTVAKLNGAAILLHSCLSNGVLDPPINCLCRKYITADQARHLVNVVGRAVDFQTRKEFFNNAPIVEKSRLKSPPLSSVGQRIAIERKTEHRDLDEKEIARLRATADEDKLWRAREQDCKIDVEHAIAVEEQMKLVRVYSDKEWLEMEATFALHRGFCDGIGIDERTLGSVGLNVRSQRAALTDEEEIEERDEKPATDEVEPELENEPTSIDDVQTEVEFEVVAEDSEETEEEFEEAA